MSIEENAVHAGNSFSPMLISDADFQRMVTFVKSNYGIDLSRKRQLISTFVMNEVKHEYGIHIPAFLISWHTCWKRRTLMKSR